MVLLLAWLPQQGPALMIRHWGYGPLVWLAKCPGALGLLQRVSRGLISQDRPGGLCKPCSMTHGLLLLLLLL